MTFEEALEMTNDMLKTMESMKPDQVVAASNSVYAYMLTRISEDMINEFEGKELKSRLRQFSRHDELFRQSVADRILHEAIHLDDVEDQTCH